VSRRGEVTVVYLAGLAQGLALVTYPAVSSVLVSPTGYDLTSSAYGGLFLPQAIAAITASLLGARLSGSVTPRRLFQLGLAADVLAMTLLLVSQAAMGQPAGYVLLLLGTLSLGVGFGLTVPTLNGYAAAFFPAGVGRATLVLNALLGLGTALAPLLSALFLGLDAWWALPAIGAIALTLLLLATLRLPLTIGAPGAARRAPPNAPRPRLPDRFWVFATAAALYGIVETVNGNWSTVYMASDLGASASTATLALAAFWGMVTIGRLLFAAVERWLPEERTYRILPFVAAVALGLAAVLPAGQPNLGVVAFGLAGLGCSALLPLTIGFAELELVVLGGAVAGLLIALYQVGYGIAAFGVGPLESALGIGLAAIMAVAALVAVALGLVTTIVVRGSPKPAM
jgi:Major Facilitator Superfamily